MKIGDPQYSAFFQHISPTCKTIAALLVILLTGTLGMTLSAQDPGPVEITADRTEKGDYPDSLRVRTHSPHKATLYSMILPGLGQAYNRKYWKIPIVYAGFGVFYYLIDYNNTEYKLWREAYYHTLQDPDNEEEPVNDYERFYGDNPDFLRDRKNDARRYRDLNYILAGLWYVLNILDATVDAHLFTWEVDDNLSLRVEPQLQNPVGYYKPVGGVKFSLRF